MPTPEAIGEHRDLLVSELLFGLRDRLDAADELADQAPGDPLAAVDLLDTLEGIAERGRALRALGLGQRPPRAA